MNDEQVRRNFAAALGPEHSADARGTAPGDYRPVDEGCGLPQTERRGDWMQTFTGRQYWPLDPRADDVDGADIAHHLSMLCRYCGACRRFYSVAEHSLGVLYVGTRQLERIAPPGTNLRVAKAHLLLHDAPEAYCHDLIRPIKRCVPGYAKVEAANAAAITIRYDLDVPTSQLWALIKDADNAMLLAEQAALMAPAPAKWASIDVPDDMRQDATAWFHRYSGNTLGPAQAERVFLEAMQRLGLE